MNEDTGKEIDQAAELRKLIGEVESNQKISNEETNIKVSPEEKEQEVDILNLPPRKEVHSGIKTPLKLKVSKSVVRLLFIVVIVLAIVVGVILLNEYDVIDFNSYFNV